MCQQAIHMKFCLIFSKYNIMSQATILLSTLRVKVTGNSVKTYIKKVVATVGRV